MISNKIKKSYFILLVISFLIAVFSSNVYEMYYKSKCDKEIKKIYNDPICHKEQIEFKNKTYELILVNTGRSFIENHYDIYTINENNIKELIHFDLEAYNQRSEINNNFNEFEFKFLILDKIITEKLFKNRLQSIEYTYYTYFKVNNYTLVQCENIKSNQYRKICLKNIK
jgi:hypothetical protein